MTADHGHKRACVRTLGCRLNQSETHLLAERLEQAGYEIVPFGEQADLGIINTCTVTHEADAKSRQLVRAFIRRNPHAYTVVAGCYSELGYRALARIQGVDLIIGNQQKLRVLDYVTCGKNEAPLIVRDTMDGEDFEIAFDGATPITRRANLKIQDGCGFSCAYCVIPLARGPARSRAFDNLVAEAEALVRRGAKEIVLTGVNLGCYRHDGRTLCDVVARLAAVPGLARLRISSVEPTTVGADLVAMMAEPGHILAPHLHIPVQSGSDSLLGRLRRRHTRADFVDFVRYAHTAVPGVCIGTDILAGAPGESDADFAQTLSLLEECPVAYAHVFVYSDREGTETSRSADKVDPAIANRRSAEVRRLAAAKRRAFHGQHVGQTAEVLFEEKEGAYWFGHTRNYIRVGARAHAGELTNTFAQVRLTRVCGDWMEGHIVHGT